MTKEFVVLGGLALAVTAVVIIAVVLKRPSTPQTGTGSGVTLLSATQVPTAATPNAQAVPAGYVSTPTGNVADPYAAGL